VPASSRGATHVAIKYRCKCGRLYNLREELSGRLAKCATCRTVFRVPNFELPAYRKPGEGFVPLHKPRPAQGKSPEGTGIAGIVAPEAAERPAAESELDFAGKEFVLDLGEETAWAYDSKWRKPGAWLGRNAPGIATLVGLIVMLGSLMATILTAVFVITAHAGRKPPLLDCMYVLTASLVLNAVCFLAGRIASKGRRLGVYGLVGLMCVYIPAGVIAVMAGRGVYFSAGVLALVVGLMCLFPAAAISFAYWRCFSWR